MIRQTALLSIIRVINIAFASMVGIFIARILGDEARGIYSLGTTVFVLSTSAGLLGADIRIRVQAFQFKTLGEFFIYYKKLFFLGWGIGCCVVLALSFVQQFILPWWLWIFFLLGLGAVLWQEMFYALYHIQGKVLRPVFVSSMGSYIVVFLCFIGLFAMGTLTIEAALLLFTVQIMLSVGLYVAQNVPLVQKDKKVKPVKVLPSYINSLANVLSKRVDILLLAPLASFGAVGQFAVAISVFEVVMIPAMLLGQSFLNQNNELRYKGWIYLGYALAAAGFLYWIAPYLVLWVFGPHFKAATLLMPMCAFLVPGMLCWTYMQGMLWRSGQRILFSTPVVFVVLVKLLALPWAFHSYGLAGVVLLSSVIYMLGALISYILRILSRKYALL